MSNNFERKKIFCEQISAKIKLYRIKNIKKYFGSKSCCDTLVEYGYKSPLKLRIRILQLIRLWTRKIWPGFYFSDTFSSGKCLSSAVLQDLMWTDARDMWYVAVDSCWAEFLLSPSPAIRPLPLVDALPLAAWLYAKPKGKKASLPPSPPPP